MLYVQCYIQRSTLDLNCTDVDDVDEVGNGRCNVEEALDGSIYAW